MSGAYLIVCNPNGKWYVGSSVNVKKRWSEHRYDLNKNQHPNRHLQNAWNKYGASAFSFLLAKRCPPERSALQECEQTIMDMKSDFNIQDVAYNPAGRVVSAATRDKLSVSTKLRIAREGNPMKGKKRPDLAARNRISKPSPERSAAIASQNKKVFGGKPLSAEHKAKIAAALKGKPKSKEHRSALAKAARRRRLLT